MGQITDAFCDGCGYTATVVIGGGRTNFLEHSAWPAYCSGCNDLVSVNTQASRQICSKCGSHDVAKYGSAILSSDTGTEVLRWGNDFIKSDVHFCPSCRNHTLRFGTGHGGLMVLFD